MKRIRCLRVSNLYSAKIFLYVRRYISGSPLAPLGFDLYTAVHETRHLVQILIMETGLPSELVRDSSVV
jgi:hypothetical protein